MPHGATSEIVRLTEESSDRGPAYPPRDEKAIVEAVEYALAQGVV
jgi:hypothetical protein